MSEAVSVYEAKTHLSQLISRVESGFLPFAERHAAALRDLPFHHKDPFDRMLICQAQVDGLILLTVDDNCRKYDILTR